MEPGILGKNQGIPAVKIMDTKNITLPHLASLSTADLLSIADELCIDIPENLNRSFIIREIFETAEELQAEKTEGEDISEIELEEEISEKKQTLPDTYNETEICAVLRNPAWIFVYWDISAADISRLNSDFSFKSLCLRVSFWKNQDDEKPLEAFDVQLGFSDRQQYVLLSPGKNFVRIDLVALYSGGREDENLAVSRKIELPKGSEILNSLPGREVEAEKLVELSALKGLLTTHFENHRQSFL